VRFLVWLLIGFLIYFSYSRWHARLQTGTGIRPDMLDAMKHGHAPQSPTDLR
jgi:hypothetical protein